MKEHNFEMTREHEIPILKGGQFTVDDWISFNYAKGCKAPEKYGVHFFIDDYQFVRVWKEPERYLPMLAKFQAVCSPDFSTFTDFPGAIQLYNHYRKHWVGAYWQQHGLKVIPTISWADENSFDWCFEGEPVGSTVAVSSVGTQHDPKAKRLFELGYAEMKRQLQPSRIILYGNIPECCEGDNIVPVKAFQTKWRETGE